MLLIIRPRHCLHLCARLAEHRWLDIDVMARKHAHQQWKMWRLWILIVSDCGRPGRNTEICPSAASTQFQAEAVGKGGRLPVKCRFWPLRSREITDCMKPFEIFVLIRAASFKTRCFNLQFCLCTWLRCVFEIEPVFKLISMNSGSPVISGIPCKFICWLHLLLLLPATSRCWSC